MSRLLLAAVLLLLAGCDSQRNAKPAPAIGQAFAGPIKLNLRQEIHPQSRIIGSAKHGEKLEILQVRRRFVRVRNARGEEGWTDSRQLLSTEQMQALDELAKYARKLPSQGEATVYEGLNMHVEPSRPSTSFYQITEGTRVDVVGRRVVQRSNEAPKANIQIAKPAPPSARRKPQKEPKIPPPPRPPSPGLPSNWRELSKTEAPAEPAPATIEPEKHELAKKVVLEDWSLIRSKDGKAGWVLTRNLVMAIPDEVAQYSEGARISSYFALSDVRDGDQTKHNWLWTTIRDSTQTYDFDSFRVFTYVLRKHRYETAYIERNVVGYYPVQAVRGSVPKFSLIVLERDGTLHRKTYALEGYIVRKVADEIYKPPKESEAPAAAPGLPGSDKDEDQDEEEKPSLTERIKDFFRRRGSQ